MTPTYAYLRCGKPLVLFELIDAGEGATPVASVRIDKDTILTKVCFSNITALYTLALTQ